MWVKMWWIRLVGIRYYSVRPSNMSINYLTPISKSFGENSYFGFDQPNGPNYSFLETTECMMVIDRNSFLSSSPKVILR
jgi:hypothetical protein